MRICMVVSDVWLIRSMFNERSITVPLLSKDRLRKFTDLRSTLHDLISVTEPVTK